MAEQLDLLISGGTVVTMDGTFRVIADGAVGIRAGRLVVVGPASTITEDYAATRTIDATGKIVMPGLVDAHAHAGHGLTKGLLEGRGKGWMELMETLYHRASTPAFWYAEGLLSALERLQFGVTTGLSLPGSLPRIDDLRYVGESIRAHEEVGIRYIAAVGPPVGPWPRTFANWDSGQPQERELSLDEALDKTEEAIAAFHGRADGRIRVYPTPSNITMDPNGKLDGPDPRPDSIQVGRAIRRMADRYRVPIHTHAFGGMIRQVARGYPELLGPDISIAHCTGLDAEEVRILGEAGASVAHGPLTYAVVHARCPVMELLEAGANVVISTDASSPDRSYDLLAQVHPAIQLQRVHYQDGAVLPGGKALAMVTIDAARALGMQDEIGSLEIGKKADLILIDAQRPHFHPFVAELAPHRLAYMATGQDVQTVIVDGRILMEDRQILTTDTQAALVAADAEAWSALRRAEATDALPLPRDFWTALRYRR